MATELTCPKCKSALAPTTAPITEMTACHGCRRPTWARTFPAFSATVPKEQASESAVLSDEATCLHHPQKKATAICAVTGHFVCQLCCIEVDGKTYSPAGLEKRLEKSEVETFSNTHTAYDQVVLTIGIVSTFVLPFILMPLGWYYTWKHWKGEPGRRPPSKMRFVIGNLMPIVVILFFAVIILLAGGLL
jgi:hypothetical protein